MEPPRFKVGDRVQLAAGAIPNYPVMEVAQIDEGAGKAQIRFSRAGTRGYSYLFWRDLADVLAEGGDKYGRTPTENAT